MATNQNQDAKPGLFARLGKFYHEVRDESRKVTWPSWERAKVDVVVVVIASAAFAVFIGLEDYVLAGAFKLLLGN